MPSPVLRFLPPFCTILPRRARPLPPVDEYVIAAPAAFIISEEIPAPDAVLPAILVFHIAPREQAGSQSRRASRFLGIS